MCHDGKGTLTYFPLFSDFALYLDTQYIFFFQIMSGCDQAFDPNILIGHCDLISRFSDFALYLDTYGFLRNHWVWKLLQPET